MCLASAEREEEGFLCDVHINHRDRNGGPEDQPDSVFGLQFSFTTMDSLSMTLGLSANRVNAGRWIGSTIKKNM